MEFPQLGQHCTVSSCKKLDFLPMKCDSCKEIFCIEHFKYTQHSCAAAKEKDFQVPVCPLCNEPVPTPRGTTPDITVGRHIDQQCQDDKAKIYTNRCCYKTCKKKEMISLKCDSCQKNYCIKHRLAMDHECSGPKISQMRGASRSNQSIRPPESNNRIAEYQYNGGMSEDEALARALAMSEQQAQGNSNQPKDQRCRMS